MHRPESFCAQSLIVQNSSQTTLIEPVMHHMVHVPATSLLEHVFYVMGADQQYKSKSCGSLRTWTWVVAGGIQVHEFPKVVGSSHLFPRR